MKKLIFKLIAFIFKSIKSLIYSLLPEEKRQQIKEGAKDSAITAGKFSFFLVLKLIRPASAFILIAIVSGLYANIPSIFDISNKQNNKSLEEFTPVDRRESADEYLRRTGIRPENSNQANKFRDINDLKQNPIIFTDEDSNEKRTNSSPKSR